MAPITRSAPFTHSARSCTFTPMSSHSERQAQSELKARQNSAGRFGFILGCVGAVLALLINLWRSPRPWSVASIALAVLMAALNIPMGIAIGLLGERLTRR